MKAPPFPLKQCWSAPETLGGIVYENLSITACTSLKNQHCLGEEGDECAVHIKNLQTVPGLLASIVGPFLTDQKTECQSKSLKISGSLTDFVIANAK